MSFIRLLIVVLSFQKHKSCVTCIEDGLIMLLPSSCIDVLKLDSTALLKPSVLERIETRVCGVRKSS